MDTAIRARLDPVVADLQRIFGARLEAVVAYGRHAHEHAHSLALVSSLTLDDLTAMAAAAARWHHAGAATPLVLPRDEFAQSLDAFPIEYGEIIDTHVVLLGTDPFAGIGIDTRDLRRAIEAQAASHLLHLRENFIEDAGRPGDIDALVRRSAPGFALLLRRMARLDGAASESVADLSHWAATRPGLDPRVVGDVLALATDPAPGVDAVRLFPEYLATMDALLRAIDQWPH
ncbi:MAG: hypothetical protein IT177_04755 [Acidobacteria bacterium]|nr:hypothetical protein [Acidobacteriota bacterium]